MAGFRICSCHVCKEDVQCGVHKGTFSLKENFRISTNKRLVVRRSQRTSAPSGPYTRQDPRTRSEAFNPLTESYKGLYDETLAQLISLQAKHCELEQNYIEAIDDKLFLAEKLDEAYKELSTKQLQEELIDVSSRLESLNQETNETPELKTKYDLLLADFRRIGSSSIAMNNNHMNYV